MQLLSECGRTLYPLGDRHIMHKHGPILEAFYGTDKNIMAINSYIFRCPKKGEWYLSGSETCAYRAPNDLTYAYYMATIVRIKTITINRILKPTGN